MTKTDISTVDIDIQTNTKRAGLQVKICGLTRIREAVFCAQAGADAIGFVFYDKSPRNLGLSQAKKITLQLPRSIVRIGVFVNPSLDFLMERVEHCRLSGVQLHGNEPNGFVEQLTSRGIFVIKALFHGKSPGMDQVPHYKTPAYLVEYGRGKLPGGNALAWDWGAAKGVAAEHPTILAGGLSPENVFSAVTACRPAAVDVSSGVESSPGRKDMKKVRAFMAEIKKCNSLYKKQGVAPRRIFCDQDSVF